MSTIKENDPLYKKGVFFVEADGNRKVVKKLRKKERKKKHQRKKNLSHHKNKKNKN